MFEQNSPVNDDEFVILLYPVRVRRKDIQPVPLMAMPAAASPQPLPASTEPLVPPEDSTPQPVSVPARAPALLPARRKRDYSASHSDKWAEPASDKQRSFVESLSIQHHIPLPDMLREAEAESLEKLTKEQAGMLIQKYFKKQQSSNTKFQDNNSIW